ncbi:MAG: response regulator [Acidobacteriota bacterium]|nr:response regulator [Acidobacteriota bacterium]
MPLTESSDISAAAGMRAKWRDGERFMVLIADDDRITRIQLTALLESWDYRVTAVLDGAEAWEILSCDDRPHLAVLDWMMPRIDGVEVVRRVRACAPRVPPYLILLTSVNDADDSVRALEAGADDFISKPFSTGELHARLSTGRRIVDLQAALARRVAYAEGALQARQAAERALQESELRSRLLFATIPQPVWVYDPSSLRFLEVNDTTVARYGFTREEFLSMSLADIRAPGEVGRLSEHLRYPRASQGFSGPWKHTTKTGEILDVEIYSRTIDLSGRPAVLVVAQDVTERKRIEIELRHAQKLEAVGSLAAGIAHEINTPIQFVGDNLRFLKDAFSGVAQLIPAYRQLKEAADSGVGSGEALAAVKRAEGAADIDYLEKEVPAALDQTMEGVGRVATIVRALKEFAHPSIAEKCAVDLNKAISNTLIVARNEIKYVADVRTDFGDIPAVICNQSDIGQVILNLLVNAAHAVAEAVKGTDCRGLISIRTWQEGEFVAVEVEDNGSGISEDIRGRIFEPFFTTKEPGHGTGQGLAIARSIVMEKHRGTLDFRSEVGRGATFCVRLPIREAASGKRAIDS